MSEHADVRPGGNKFGKYRLIERREEVAVGEAYSAKLMGMAGFEKRVELWCFGKELWGDADLFECAMREAARGALLSHANIAQVLDVGTVGGVSFVATEHVAGPTLEDVLRRQGTLAWPVAAYIAGEVAAGLSYVHRRRRGNGELLRLVHRRLAPGRVSLGRSGDVKVTGFGTPWACAVANEYLSPEELRREPVDGRADVFALGTILHTCLPQTGVPQALRDAVGRALEPYPERRSTAAELQGEMAEILHAGNRQVAPRDLTELAVTGTTV